MRHAPILMLCIASLSLTACGGWNGFGAAQIPRPDASVTAPCPRPEVFLAVADWEIIAGRLGVALIECGAEKAALVGYVDALRGGGIGAENQHKEGN